MLIRLLYYTSIRLTRGNKNQDNDVLIIGLDRMARRRRNICIYREIFNSAQMLVWY